MKCGLLTRYGEIRTYNCELHCCYSSKLNNKAFYSFKRSLELLYSCSYRFCLSAAVAANLKQLLLPSLYVCRSLHFVNKNCFELTQTIPRMSGAVFYVQLPRICKHWGMEQKAVDHHVPMLICDFCQALFGY